jgi:hypothetical protein
VGGDTAPSITGATQDVIGRIVGYLGCIKSGDPFATMFASQSNASSATVTAPAIGILIGQCMGIFAGGWTTTGGAAPTFSGYSGTLPTFTEAVDNNITGITVNPAICLADGICNTTGTTGSRTATATFADVNSGALLALIPEAYYKPRSPTPFRGRAIIPKGLRRFFIVPISPKPQPAAAGGGTSYSLTADQGLYNLSGQTTRLSVTRQLLAVQGSYSLNGQIAGLKFGHAAIAAQGSYSLNGQAANIRVARILASVQGSYSLNGQTANLVYSGAGPKTLTADFGTYSLNGQSSVIKAARSLSAAPGAYTLTGNASVLKLARVLVAAQGSYSLNGISADLIYSGAAPSVPGDGGNYIIIFRRRHRRS